MYSKDHKNTTLYISRWQTIKALITNMKQELCWRNDAVCGGVWIRTLYRLMVYFSSGLAFIGVKWTPNLCRRYAMMYTAAQCLMQLTNISHFFITFWHHSSSSLSFSYFQDKLFTRGSIEYRVLISLHPTKSASTNVIKLTKSINSSPYFFLSA